MIRPDNHTQTLVNDHISAFVARFCLLFVCAAECLGHPESLEDPAVAGGGYRRLQEAKESWKGHRIGNSGRRRPLLGNDDPKISGFLPYNQFRKWQMHLSFWHTDIYQSCMSPMLVHDMDTLEQHLDEKLYDHQTQHPHIHIYIYTYTDIHIYTHTHKHM